jgi:hypothetical protein
MIRRFSTIVFGDQSRETEAIVNHLSTRAPNVPSLATPVPTWVTKAARACSAARLPPLKVLVLYRSRRVTGSRPM